jgi:serine/threonine protein kinase
LGDDIDSRARERVGTVLGDKWTLERLLGVGGMAAVYAARHRNGARAAVKVLHPSLSRHAEVRERFLREGYASNRVEHPGAVKVLDDDVVTTGPDEGTAFIVMELLEGESLQDRLERGPALTERDFLAVAEGVLDVLDAAHARNVVHRDLKPENLFLVKPDTPGERPRVKVLDFGLARLLDGQAITSYGLALGTPSFMSPEQAAGRVDEIDGRTDLFALGATGFRVRTGRRIHEGANAIELVNKMASIAAPPIRRLSPEVSEGFARVIDRALEFRREDRYEDAAAMREDVRRAIAQLDGQALTLLAVEPPASFRPSSERPPFPSRSSPPPEPPSLPALLSSPALPRREASRQVTVELSGSDLESLPVVSPPPRRRRRSVVQRVAMVTLAAALLLFAGIAGKLLLDRPANETVVAPVASVAPIPRHDEPSVAPVPSARGVASSEGPAPTAAANTLSAAPTVAAIPATSPAPRPAAVATAAATHSHPLPKVGPATVHKVPKHRKSRR